MIEKIRMSNKKLEYAITLGISNNIGNYLVVTK